MGVGKALLFAFPPSSSELQVTHEPPQPGCLYSPLHPRASSPRGRPSSPASGPAARGWLSPHYERPPPSEGTTHNCFNSLSHPDFYFNFFFFFTVIHHFYVFRSVSIKLKHFDKDSASKQRLIFKQEQRLAPKLVRNKGFVKECTKASLVL